MSLRATIIRGGTFLVFRSGAVLGISAVGTLLLTRLIGPAQYGLYAGSLAIVLFLVTLGRFGTDVFLVRREVEPTREVYDQVFTLMLATGLVVTGVGILLLPPLVGVVADPRFSDPLRVLLVSLPLTLLVVPALASLERALNYRAVALVELTAYALNFGLAVGLALLDLGVWAPVTGYILAQVWLLGSSHALARRRPRLAFSRPILAEILRFGIGYSASVWAWQARELVNPLVVGRFLGPEGVGVVSLTQQIVRGLGFPKDAIYRISLPALNRIRHDRVRLQRVVSEAMALQVIGVGPLLVAFALLAPLLVLYFLGEEWSGVLDLYPLLAVASLANGVFSMQSALLYVFDRAWAVLAFHVVHVVLFAAASVLLVRGYGVVGIGLAEMVALAAYGLLHLLARASVAVSYARVLPWSLAFLPALFALYERRLWTVALLLPLLVFVLLPRQRAELAEYVRQVRARAPLARPVVDR